MTKGAAIEKLKDFLILAKSAGAVGKGCTIGVEYAIWLIEHIDTSEVDNG